MRATRPARRPRGVTLLTALVLIITGLHLLRGVAAVQQWEFLSSFPELSPLYLMLTGFSWALLGLLLFGGLLRTCPWAPKATAAAALAFSLYYWLDRLLLSNRSGQRLNGAFAFTATVLLLVFIFWTVNRPAVRRFFRDGSGELENEPAGSAELPS